MSNPLWFPITFLRTMTMLAALFLLFGAATTASAQNTPSFNDPALNLAMGAKAKLGKAPNGAIINEAVVENEELIKHQTTKTYELTKDVYVIPGTTLNAAFVVAPEGVVVWESGESTEDGKRYREEIRKITQKPIKAVIYSHAHYTLGTSALIKGEKDVMIIGHPNLNKNMTAGGLGSYFPETEPLQWARTIQHLNMLLPDKGPNAKFGFVVELKEKGFVPVNTPIQNGQTLKIAGIEVQFFTEGGSDTDDCTTAWIPKKKVVFNNIFWPMMPNFYTPRGAKFRDPRFWVKALKIIRDLGPEYLISQHSITLKGSDKIRQRLTNYMDFCNMVLDQTLRGILKGVGPEDLRNFVVMPPHLRKDPWLFEGYGMLSWYAPYIMNHALGWWDGDASTLVKLPSRDRVARLVPALGGRDKVLSLAREAQAKKEYAWALELTDYVYRIDPDDAETRALKAELMKTVGHSTTSSIARAFLLSQALALEGKVTVPKIVPPSVEQISANPATFVNYHRVRIDPMKAKNTDKVLAFRFTGDKGKTVALHIRKGVCEYVPDIGKHYRPPDITMTLDPKSWALLYLNTKNLGELVASKSAAVDGNAKEAAALLDLFDRFEPSKNTLIPQDANRLADPN